LHLSRNQVYYLGMTAFFCLGVFVAFLAGMILANNPLMLNIVCFALGYVLCMMLDGGPTCSA